MKILVSSPAFNQPTMKKSREFLKKVVDEVIYNPYGRTLQQEEILKLWKDIDGIIAGIELYTNDLLKWAPKTLKVISRYGTGYENINIEAAGKQGIVVTNTPGVNAPAVADLALGLTIAISRKIPQLDGKVRKGKWIRTIGIGLTGKTLGIIGLGAVGKEVALRARGFSMKIMAYDPFIDKQFTKEHKIEMTTLDKIFTESDYITLHIPVNKETEKIINEENINKMKKSVILINTARGKLIDEKALYEALVKGKIAGAGLDVFEQEPPGQISLFKLNNVVVTPHIGGHTQQACELMAKVSIENALAILKNKHCPFIVNKNYLKGV